MYYIGFTFFVIFLKLLFQTDTVISEDSIIVSLFQEGTLPGNLTSIPGNLDSRLVSSSGRLSSRTMTFINSKLRILSMACDQGNKTIYISELSTQSVYRLDYVNAWFNDSRSSFHRLHPGISNVDAQIAYDWINRNVYWTDSLFKWIVLQPAYAKEMTMYKTLITKNLSKPFAIAVDPSQGFLFWSDVASSPIIERASLSGDSRQVLVYKGLKNPNSLVADATTQAIFWTDSSRDTIETCSYNGQNRRVLRRLNGGQLTSIAMYKDILCVTDVSSRILSCYRKSSGDLTKTISGFDGVPSAVTLYDSSIITVPSNLCQSKSCEHICVTSSGGARCICREGYSLNQDGRTCSTIHGLFDKGVLLSNATHICMLEIRIISGMVHGLSCILSNVEGITHLETDGTNSYIFYVDSTNRNIRIHNRANMGTLTFASTSVVSGLAYDWINKYLYWAESDTGRIKRASVTTKYTSNVYDSIPTPSDLTIDPFNSVLYWVSSEVTGKVIKSGKTDGSSTKTIVSGVHSNNPSGVYFDTIHDRLYWSNAGSLRSIRPNGTDIKYHFSIGTTTNLFIYKEYVLWTTVSPDLRATRLTSSNAETIKSLTTLGTITGMTVFDPSLQRSQKGACETSNGDCEQICVVKQSGRVCECSLGFQLQNDQQTCSSLPMYDQFLLVTDYSHNKVYQISLANKSIVALDLPNINSVVGIVYNFKSNMVVWSEIQTGQIRQSLLSGENATIIHSLGFAYADRLAIDFSSENIYFSEISRLGLDGSIKVVRNRASPKKVVENLSVPRAIALYPSKGYLFWTDHKTDVSHIARSNMDGSSKSTLVSVSTKWPNGLAIDYNANRLYWTDGYHDKLETSDINGGDRREILVDSGSHLMALVLDGSNLYYTAWSRQVITKLDKNTGQQETWMSHTAEFGRLDSLDIYPGENQPVNILCSMKNGKCSTYCLPTVSGRTCACEDGVSLNSDRRTCQGVTQCPLTIPNGNLESSCLRYVSEICSYDCSTGYKKSSYIQNITCGSNGFWNESLQQLCKLVERTCPSALLNGTLDSSCGRKILETCSYSCHPGFIKTTLSVTCQSNGKWNHQLDSVCSEIHCSNVILNGDFSEECSYKIGQKCTFTCKKGYSSPKTSMTATCKELGEWDDKESQFCTEESKGEQDRQPPSISAIVGGTAGGWVFFLLIIVAVVIFVKRKRNINDERNTDMQETIINSSSRAEFNNSYQERPVSSEYSEIGVVHDFHSPIPIYNEPMSDLFNRVDHNDRPSNIYVEDDYLTPQRKSHDVYNMNPAFLQGNEQVFPDLGTFEDNANTAIGKQEAGEGSSDSNATHHDTGEAPQLNYQIFTTNGTDYPSIKRTPPAVLPKPNILIPDSPYELTVNVTKTTEDDHDYTKLT